MTEIARSSRWTNPILCFDRCIFIATSRDLIAPRNFGCRQSSGRMFLMLRAGDLHHDGPAMVVGEGMNLRHKDWSRANRIILAISVLNRYSRVHQSTRACGNKDQGHPPVRLQRDDIGPLLTAQFRTVAWVCIPAMPYTHCAG